MHNFSRPVLHPLENAGDCWRIYRGRSMLRVFSPGDLLQVEKITAGNAAPGDIICFTGSDGAETVHRVVGRNACGDLVTMGDNNPAPDPDPVSPAATVFRVTGIRKAGTIKHISAGRSGMAVFRFNRLRRMARMLSGRGVAILQRMIKYKIPLKNSVRFGPEEIFFFCKRPAAKKNDNGEIRWLSPWLKIFFTVGRNGK